MAALPVLPPPRGRLPSNPGTSEGALWQTIGAIQADVAAVKADAGMLKLGVADLKATLTVQNAGTRHQTIQLIIAGVVTCVTAVVGARITTPKPEPSQTVIQTTAYDRALEACKKLQTDADRAACIIKVASDAVGLSPR